MIGFLAAAWLPLSFIGAVVLGRTVSHADKAELSFEDAMNSGAPIVDNATDPAVIGQYGLEWDGDRCHECRRPVDDDVVLCDDCNAPECPRCQGDGCDWHLSPTNGAIEIDDACPSCTGTGKALR